MDDTYSHLMNLYKDIEQEKYNTPRRQFLKQYEQPFPFVPVTGYGQFSQRLTNKDISPEHRAFPYRSLQNMTLWRESITVEAYSPISFLLTDKLTAKVIKGIFEILFRFTPDSFEDIFSEAWRVTLIYQPQDFNILVIGDYDDASIYVKYPLDTHKPEWSVVTIQEQLGDTWISEADVEKYFSRLLQVKTDIETLPYRLFKDALDHWVNLAENPPIYRKWIRKALDTNSICLNMTDTDPVMISYDDLDSFLNVDTYDYHLIVLDEKTERFKEAYYELRKASGYSLCEPFLVERTNLDNKVFLHPCSLQDIIDNFNRDGSLLDKYQLSNMYHLIPLNDKGLVDRSNSTEFKGLAIRIKSGIGFRVYKSLLVNNTIAAIRKEMGKSCVINGDVLVDIKQFDVVTLTSNVVELPDGKTVPYYDPSKVSASKLSANMQKLTGTCSNIPDIAGEDIVQKYQEWIKSLIVPDTSIMINRMFNNFLRSQLSISSTSAPQRDRLRYALENRMICMDSRSKFTEFLSEADIQSLLSCGTQDNSFVILKPEQLGFLQTLCRIYKRKSDPFFDESDYKGPVFFVTEADIQNKRYIHPARLKDIAEEFSKNGSYLTRDFELMSVRLIPLLNDNSPLRKLPAKFEGIAVEIEKSDKAYRVLNVSPGFYTRIGSNTGGSVQKGDILIPYPYNHDPVASIKLLDLTETYASFPATAVFPIYEPKSLNADPDKTSLFG